MATKTLVISYAGRSGVATGGRDGGGRPAAGVTILGDTILCETITLPICGEYLTFFTLFGCPHPHLD